MRATDKEIVLIQTFSAPIYGYWDGGGKKVFEWHIEGHRSPHYDSKGAYVRVGSWQANRWCHVARGKSAKATLGNLRRRLSAAAKRNGLACTFEYEAVTS